MPVITVSIPSKRGLHPDGSMGCARPWPQRVSIPSKRGLHPDRAEELRDIYAAASQSPQNGAFIPTQSAFETLCKADNVSIPSKRGLHPDQVKSNSEPINTSSQSPQNGAFIPTASLVVKNCWNTRVSIPSKRGLHPDTSRGDRLHLAICLNPLKTGPSSRPGEGKSLTKPALSQSPQNGAFIPTERRSG